MKNNIVIVIFILLSNAIIAQTINYNYDSLGRLTQIIYPDSSIIKYAYDAAGNRVSKEVFQSTIRACPQSIVTFYAGLSDTTKNYQWQVSTTSEFVNIIPGPIYSGVDSSTLTLYSPPTNFYNYKYRCLISDSLRQIISPVFTLKFEISWIGVADTAWENSLNWNCNTIPDCNTDVLIPSGTPRYPKIFSEAHCRSLKLDTVSSVDVTTGYKLWIGNTGFGITCPQDTVIELNPGDCNFQLNYSVTTGGSCDGIITQSSGLPTGSLFPIGTTTNCFELTDGNGYIIANCCFNVIVNEFPNPSSTLICTDGGQVSMNEICEAFVSAGLVLEGGPYGCDNDYLVSVQGFGSGLGGITIDSTALGQILNVTVSDPEGGGSCMGTISVQDVMPPQINCSDYEIGCGENIDPNTNTTPIALDGCGSVILSYADVAIPGLCAGFNYIGRIWTATDESGNAATCQQLITILPANLDSVQCPANYIGSCNNSDPNITGFPSYNGNSIDQSGLCNLFSQYSDHDSIISGLFTIIRTWTIVDTCTSEEIACVQYIVSTDNESPIITCPPNFETTCLESIDPSITGIPDVTDDCSTTINYSDDVADSDCITVFSFVTRTWTVIDNSGNSSSCQQTITVLVNNSEIVCPVDTILELNPGETSTQFAYVLSTQCNCVDTIVQVFGIESGGFFPIGTTSNCFHLVDTMGIIVDSCCFNIIVNEYDSTQCFPGGIVFNTQAEIDLFPINYACTQILGNVTIDDGGSGNITNLNGLSELTGIGGNLTIENNTSLTSLIGLNQVAYIGGILSIYSEPALTNLVGLDAIAYIGGGLYISSNNGLTNLIGLDEVDSVGGDISLQNNDALISLTGLDSVSYVGGAIDISANDALSSLLGLGLITSIGTNLYIDHNPTLLNLSGLDALNSVAGSVSINYNSGLLNITGLEALTTIDGNISISSNSAMTSLTGLSGLTSIGGGLSINNNPILISLTGLSAVTSIEGYLEINSNYNLGSLSGLDAITTIGGGLYINNNSGLTSLMGLGALDSLGGSLQVESNDGLTSLIGLSSVTSNVESIEIIYNSALTSLTGLEGINSIEGGLYINNNYALSNLMGLGSVDSVGGDFQLEFNYGLTSLTGLSSASYIGGSLSIILNGSLTSLTGLEGVNSIGGGLYIYNNYALTNLMGLGSVDSIGGDLTIAANVGMTSLTGLNSISSIGGNLSINGNDALTSLSPLNSVISIGGILEIYYNNALTSLSGLDNINSVTIADLIIQGSSILSVCDVQSICDYLNVPTNPATISGNATGCATRTEVEDDCGN